MEDMTTTSGAGPARAGEASGDVEATVRSDQVAEPDAGAGHRTTSVVVGAAALVWEQLAPPREREVARERIGLREVAVGAVFGAEDAAAGLIDRIRKATANPRERSARRAAAVANAARRRVAELAERGAVEESVGRRRAAHAMNSLMDTVATAAVVDRVVDAQVDRILRPLVVAVLDDVLAVLEAEPERVQTLIRGQRESMVDELVRRIRSGATAGDTAVDRLAARILHRANEQATTASPVTGPP